jgi:NO-binding membrane sensor protein with MHYT domain
MNEPYLNPTMINANGQPQNSLGRNRLQYFGLTMVVMGISFILYYLGFFGSVDGPLTPAKLGATLSGLGVTQRHVIVILLSLLIGAVSWNWVFNIVSALIGARMTCTARGKGSDGFCGLPAKRNRLVSKRSGQVVMTYVCDCGHRQSEAHFHPLKKGAVSNTVWIACLAFVIIAFFGV